MRQLSMFAFLALAAGACDSDPTGSGGSGGSGAGGGGDGGGVTVTCTGTPSPDATDVTGRWAYLEVGSQLVQAPGFSPFHNKIISVLLLDVTQAGEDVAVNGQYCDHYTEDPDAIVHAVIPDTYRAALQPITRSGTFRDGKLVLPLIHEVVGANLVDIASDELPTAADDTRLVDQDGDGHPGVTIRLTGLIDGEVYVAQRKATALDGIATSAARIEGKLSFSSEQSTVATSPEDLIDTVKGTTTFVDQELCASHFAMVRVAAGTDCAAVKAQGTSLFR